MWCAGCFGILKISILSYLPTKTVEIYHKLCYNISKSDKQHSLRSIENRGFAHVQPISDQLHHHNFPR